MSKQKNIEQFKRIKEDLACEVYATKVTAELFNGDVKTQNKLSLSQHRNVTMTLNGSVNALCDAHNGTRVGLLIFASGTRHGGGAESGAVAQEESIMRTTSWSDVTVPSEFFAKSAPFYTNYVAIAPGYIFYNDDFEPIEPLKVTFLSSAAPNLNVPYPKTELKNVIKTKLRNILQAAEKVSLSTVIVGGYGCGVFKGNPEMYAECWRDVIAEGWYHGHLVFAFLNDSMLNTFHAIIPSKIQESGPHYE